MLNNTLSTGLLARTLSSAICILALQSAPVLADQATLAGVLASEHRGVSSERDQYRHPNETLTFFGLQPAQTVVEIWPGSQGWYSEILAPYLKHSGQFYAAQFNADSSAAFYRNARQHFIDKLAADPLHYSAVEVTTFNPPQYVDIAPKASVDMVLTFRNVHNWYMRGGGETRVLAAFKAFYAALKPGGVLGVVEHRLPESRPAADMESSGYMHTSFVISVAEKAGFTLQAQSEVNANSADNTLHPNGVWSLPPTLRGGEKGRERFLAIGESDRMTLKFTKPD
ncbi:class I SAM-dependent methyltransferase [Pontibacter sp. JAM-7]|uniref:class I SAM-dependent methyltransferase n=1 Tax=Pontibacter sp. JAM-7 TaxID=3366581 RepID=UPI003AF4D815